MNFRSAVPFLLLAIVAGCSSQPFTRPPLPKLVKPDARAVQLDFNHALAEKFTSQDAVIISAPFRDDIAVLGVVQADRKAGTFEMAGLSQMGLELFHISGDANGNITVPTAIPPLMEQKDILLSIGRDVRRMYFDLVPPMDADYEVFPTYIEYKSNDIFYEYGGHPIVLLKKYVSGMIWAKYKVQYYDYAESDGHLYPRGIVMDNGHYHYRIVVKNRNWQTD
jgi:hypothetical protein